MFFLFARSSSQKKWDRGGGAGTVGAEKKGLSEYVSGRSGVLRRSKVELCA